MSETLEPLVKIAEIQGKGRALISSQSIKAGQIIHKDSPILLYSAQTHVGSSPNCSNCFKKLNFPQISSCPNCKTTLFCNPNCKTTALCSSHSQWVCSALYSLRSSSMDSELQTQASFLIAAYNLAVVSPSNFRILLSLQGDGVLNLETQVLHSFISGVLALFPLPNLPEFSMELTATLLAKDKHNAFGLMEPMQENGERLVRAYGFYPQASLFNHDCLPNACRFDYIDKPGVHNTDIIIRAIHDIPEGREICLSYFPVNWNFNDRQLRLLEDYEFVCNCDRCEVEKNWSEEENMEEDGEEMVRSDEENGEEVDQDFPHAYFFASYLCDRENCGGTMAPLPPSQGKPSDIMECNVCGRFRKENEVDDSDIENGDMLDE